MRYSLCSRFRGTLLGASVGEMLGKFTDVRVDSQWDSLAVLNAQSLIRLGRFDLDDWHDTFSKNSILSPFPTSSSSDAMNRVSKKAIIATLPLILFYHENEIKLRQYLQQLVELWEDQQLGVIPLGEAAVHIHKLSLLDGTLAVGYAISQSLTEKLNRADLIPQTIAFLGPHTQVAQHLAQVQILLKQEVTLERAVTELVRDAQPSTAIALAFYCFLSTLEDLRLSVLCAVKTDYQPHITSAITGAMSGAYNSTAGIPSTWRMALSRSDAKPWVAWGMKTEAEMLDLSDLLVAVWSGVYDQATHSNDLTPVAAFAAPRVIRSR